EVREFIDDNYVLGQDKALAGDDSLTQTGIIDSMGIMELVAFLDERYGVRVPDADLLPQNLDSIDNIVRYVKARLAAQGAGYDDRAVA
ncbi:MAG TPA: acyl carrier protein, partial [Trueperaceae bacterium]